jgi:hypothetical protein
MNAPLLARYIMFSLVMPSALANSGRPIASK